MPRTRLIRDVYLLTPMSVSMPIATTDHAIYLAEKLLGVNLTVLSALSRRVYDRRCPRSANEPYFQLTPS